MVNYQDCIYKTMKSRFQSGMLATMLFGVSVLLCALWKHRDSNRNYNFTCSFVWMWSLVSRIKGRTLIVGAGGERGGG
jgi:hypothetical protein